MCVAHFPAVSSVPQRLVSKFVSLSVPNLQVPALGWRDPGAQRARTFTPVRRHASGTKG